MKKEFAAAPERRAVWMGIIGNAILFAGKVFVGFSFNSIAIISDSFNSLADIIASTIVAVSIRSSYRGPDADHPLGTSAPSRSRASWLRFSWGLSASKSSRSP